MFLKENQDVKIKGQTVDGGNIQIAYIPKENASLSAVST